MGYSLLQLEKLPPDWEYAELHGTSTVPGLPTEKEKSSTKKIVCPCCMNIVEKEQAPLCENSKELEFLGFGFPLYFVFIKYCIVLLMVSIASYNAMALYLAITYTSQYCLTHTCTGVMVELSRIQETVTTEEKILRITSFIIHLACLIYMRDLISKTEQYYDERTCSLSDYSILLINLPKKTGIRRNLIKFLENNFEKPYETTQITFLPEHEQFYKLEEERRDLIIKIQKIFNRDEEEFQKEKLRLLEQLKLLEDLIHKESQKQLEKEQNDETITESLIFSCTSEQEKEEIMEQFENLSEDIVKTAFQLNQNEKCSIEMNQAPEPKEIVWENVNYPKGKQLLRLLMGWSLTIAFLAITTVVFFFVLSAKTLMIEHLLDVEKESDQYVLGHQKGTAAVFAALVGVILFNKFIMGLVLHKICDLQKHPTTASFQFQYAFKYAAGMFFTTALMTLAVEDIKFHNFYEHQYGVIEEESIMFYMNAFFVPFIWIVNPWNLYAKLKRKMNYGRNDLTQKQAHKIMENVQYTMGKRYAEIIQTIWFTYLYATIIPIGAFLTLVGLIIYYWVDKYNLLRRSSVNSNISGELALVSMKLLDFSLLAKPLGAILFDSQIRDSYSLESVILASVALIYLLIPINQILQFCHEEKFKLEEKHYQDVHHLFKETYQTLHPIYSMKKSSINKKFAGMEEHVEGSGSTLLNFVNVIQLGGNHDNESDFNDTPAPFRDASNILQSIFRRHDFTMKDLK